MAILEYNAITKGKYIEFEGEPYEILDSHVFRKQMRKPVNQVKMRHLISGKVTEYSFHAAEKSEEAEIDSRKVKYLYANKGEFWFCEENEPAKRFSLKEELVGQHVQYLKPNCFDQIHTYHDRLFGVMRPNNVQNKVNTAPPGIKGDTRQGGNKQIILETGAAINAPLFINEGDTIIVNTETGEYVSRA